MPISAGALPLVYVITTCLWVARLLAARCRLSGAPAGGRVINYVFDCFIVWIRFMKEDIWSRLIACSSRCPGCHPTYPDRFIIVWCGVFEGWRHELKHNWSNSRSDYFFVVWQAAFIVLVYGLVTMLQRTAVSCHNVTADSVVLSQCYSIQYCLVTILQLTALSCHNVSADSVVLSQCYSI